MGLDLEGSHRKLSEGEEKKIVSFGLLKMSPKETSCSDAATKVSPTVRAIIQ